MKNNKPKQEQQVRKLNPPKFEEQLITFYTPNIAFSQTVKRVTKGLFW